MYIIQDGVDYKIIIAPLTPPGTEVVFKWQGSFHNVDKLGSADDYANCDGITNTSGAHIYLLEFPTPALLSCCCSSVTKSVTWQYLGNLAWFHKSAGVKATGKKFWKKV